MSRLVEADKVQLKLLEECQNIRYFDKGREKKQIFADGIDFAWVMLNNAPTVKAIPIEFIEEQIAKTTDINNRDELDVLYAGNLGYLLKLWEKENE